MSSELSSLRQFQQAVAVPDDEIDLALAALLIARTEDPQLELAPTLERIDSMAVEVVRRCDHHHPITARLGTLLDVAIREPDLRGAVDDYYDPRNSCLNEALERRVAIPITLGILLISVGARAGLALGGTSMPMHFLVRVLGLAPPLFIDPYRGGQILTEDASNRLLQLLSHDRFTVQPWMLEVTANASILTRMLNNLRMIHQQRGEAGKLLPLLDRLLILNPGDPGLTRDRGMLYFELGLAESARRDLTAYLELAPASPDNVRIRDLLRRLG